MVTLRTAACSRYLSLRTCTDIRWITAYAVPRHIGLDPDVAPTEVGVPAAEQPSYNLLGICEQADTTDRRTERD